MLSARLHANASGRKATLWHISTFKTQNITPSVVYSICAWNAYYRFDYIWFRSAHITILPRRHVDVVMALPKRLPDLNIVFFCDFFTLDFSPSTFYPRLFTLDFLPSTFNPRLFTLDFSPSTFYPRLFTLDFLPSPSTFYPRPRHLTLDTRHSTNR